MMSTGRLFTKLGRLDEPDLKKYARKNKTNQTTNVPPHQLLSLDLDRSSSSGSDPYIIINDINSIALRKSVSMNTLKHFLLYNALSSSYLPVISSLSTISIS